MAFNNIIDTYTSAGTAVHDAIKTLRTNIRFSSVDKEIQTIVLTSVVPHDGKSTISIFLGMAMAESGQRTLLIECDCRRPMLQNYLKLRPEKGLVDVLAKKAELDEAIVNTRIPRLDLLSSSVLASPVEVLGSKRFSAVIEELKGRYDIILMDTPPLGSFIEAAILAANADGTILVLGSGSTDVAAAQTVVAQLEKAKARILGVVLNNVESSSDDYYYADYYYRDGKKKKGKHSKSESTPKISRKKTGSQAPAAPQRPVAAASVQSQSPSVTQRPMAQPQASVAQQRPVTAASAQSQAPATVQRPVAAPVPQQAKPTEPVPQNSVKMPPAPAAAKAAPQNTPVQPPVNKPNMPTQPVKTAVK